MNLHYQRSPQFKSKKIGLAWHALSFEFINACCLFKHSSDDQRLNSINDQCYGCQVWPNFGGKLRKPPLSIPCNWMSSYWHVCIHGVLFGTLQWHHSGHDGVSNHQPHDCLLNGLFKRRSKKTSKLRVAGLCEGNSRVTGQFPVQRASNAKCFHFMTSSWMHNFFIIFFIYAI